MSHLFKIVQAGSSLVDILDATKYRLKKWSRAAYAEQRKVDDAITLHVLGATADQLATNLNALAQVAQSIKQNAALSEQSQYRVPIWLQFQPDGATYLLQSELLSIDEEAFGDVFSPALNAHYLLDLPLKCARRPYWEETSAQSLYSTPAVPNDGSGIALSGARGALLSPLYVKVRTSLAAQTRLIAGLKTIGSTLSNFVSTYQAESYNARGADVANLTAGASFSGSGANAQRWTPAAATDDQRLLLWYITSNVVDQMGTYRVMARVRDNKATGPKVRIRARAGNYDGTNVAWGQYPDGGAAKYCLTANGTIELVDCGVLALPGVDTQGVTPYGFALELRGACDASPSTFDIDCVYLVPCEGFGNQSGMGIVTMSSAAGTGALPDLVLDANDRKPRGYLETAAGALLATPGDLRGSGLFLKPHTSARLYAFTQNAETGAHDISGSNTVTVTVTPRYPLLGSAS